MAGAVEVARRTDLEEMRRRGVRPNAPNYRDTPLLSIGKLVRVQVAAGRWRRATIECHDEGDGTVDVLFMNTGTAGPGQLADTEIAAEEEATLPVSAVRPLEEFEVQTEPELRLAFAEDLFATAARVKDEANCLFKLPDYEAAVEHYALAIDELRRFSSGTASSSTQVLVNQAGVLRKGTVTAINSESERADVELVDLQSGQRQVVRGAPCRTLVVVREEQLQLQTALYMNRARSLMQLSRQQEAAQDLSIVIGFWSAPGRVGTEATETNAEQERRKHLAKALFLRAKTRLARLRIEPARADVREAWSLDPPEDTAKELRSLEKNIDITHKREQISTKRLHKEICKMADAAMSNLTTEQLASFGAGGLPPGDL
mmetsp:Transcript_74121/g.241001  ORF Transcript_74121/g.241001 Transcript_74121/m.241001 type:complete len:373 (-) Transcript_74121:46-1164(-)